MATATVAPMATIATKGRATPVARARAQAGADLLADWPACRAVAWLANGAAGRRAGWPARWDRRQRPSRLPAGRVSGRTRPRRLAHRAGSLWAAPRRRSRRDRGRRRVRTIPSRPSCVLDHEHRASLRPKLAHGVEEARQEGAVDPGSRLVEQDQPGSNMRTRASSTSFYGPLDRFRLFRRPVEVNQGEELLGPP